MTGIHATPGVKTFDEESDELKKRAFTRLLNIACREFGSPLPVVRAHGKMTCREAMEAYQEWHAVNRKCDARKFAYNCRHFTACFGNRALSDITDKTAAEFVENLINDEKCYSFDSVRLAVAAASGLINYLKDKSMWNGSNPFSGVLKKYANRFAPVEPDNPRISENEWDILLRAVKKPEYRSARIFIEVSRCTGLRPSEVYRLSTENIDRRQLSWLLCVTKKAGRPMYRRIAIPLYIMTFLDNEGILGRLPLAEITVARQLRKLKTETGIDIVAKRFRKDFACRMEEAGAGESEINAHQWRNQSGVLYRNYLKFPNRAVNLCRPIIDKMFGEGKKLSVVTGNYRKE